MNILIIGCGRVGAGLASTLDRMGHDISIIDAKEDNFSRLDDSFSGFCVTGVPIDVDVLRKGGIESCEFMAAVTPDDNTNVMVSQMAKELFGVPKVLTRIYDPQRRNVFAQFGLHTVCPTTLTVDIIQRIISQSQSENVLATFGDTSMSLSVLEVPKSFIGQPVREVGHSEDEGVLAILHKDGSATLRDGHGDDPLRPGDRLVTVKLL